VLARIDAALTCLQKSLLGYLGISPRQGVASLTPARLLLRIGQSQERIALADKPADLAMIHLRRSQELARPATKVRAGEG
jgi:hypothetical protein